MKKLFLVAIIFSVCLNSFATAQDQNPNELVFDINFPGGTVTELTKSIESIIKSPPNVIVSQQAANVKLPPFVLRSVKAKDVIYSLHFLAPGLLRTGEHKNIIVVTIAEKKDREKEDTEHFFDYNHKSVFDVDFAGGTVNDLMEQIKKQTNVLPNVIIGEGAKKLQLPSFQVKAVTVRNITMSLEYVVPERLHIKSTGDLIIISLRKDDKKNQVLRYFSLARYLKKYKIEDIVTAIETGWEMQKQKIPGNIKFHEDTELLIVAGSKQQIEIANELLDQLKDSLGKKKRRK